MKIDIRDLFEGEEGLNQNMVNVILKAIKENYQSDFDYLKFKQSVINLQKMDMDEPTSIKSAFATMSTVGVDKRKILESIRHYTSIVSREKEKFAVALKNQITNQIDRPKLEAEKFDEMIAQKEQQIKQLQNEIAQIKARKETIGDELAKAEEKINTTRDQFRAVYEFFAKTLDNDKVLIDRLIN